MLKTGSIMEDSKTVNLIDYLNVLYRRKWIIIVLAAVGVVVVLAGDVLDYLRHKPNKALISLEIDSSYSYLMDDLVQYVRVDGSLDVLKSKFGLTEQEFKNGIDVRVEGNRLILEHSKDGFPTEVLNDLGEVARGRYYQLRDAKIEGEIGSIRIELMEIGGNIDKIIQGLDELKSASSEERILMLGYMNTLIKLQDRRDLLENNLSRLEALKKVDIKIFSLDGFIDETVKRTLVRVASVLVASFIVSLWVISVLEYIDKKRSITT